MSDKGSEASTSAPEVSQDDALTSRKSLNNGPFEADLFGVLYTLAKDRRTRPWVAVLKSALEFLQMLSLLLSRGFAWDVRVARWLFDAAKPFQIANLVAPKGYGAFLGAVYTVQAALVASIALSVYTAVCFKANSFPTSWPVAVLKPLADLLFSTLYVSCLNVLLTMLACHPAIEEASAASQSLTTTTTQKIKHMVLDRFPDTACAATPHSYHLVTSAIAAAALIVLSLAYAMGKVALTPFSGDPRAQRWCLVELRVFALKTVYTIAAAMLTRWALYRGILMFAVCISQAYLLTTLTPYHAWAVNILEASLATALAWLSVALPVLGTYPGISEKHLRHQETMTKLAVYGVLPVAVAGGAACWGVLRTYQAAWAKFLCCATEPRKCTLRELQELHTFRSPLAVEMTASHWKHYFNRFDGIPAEVKRAVELVFEVGMPEFPVSVPLRLAYTSFLIDSKCAALKGYNENNAALELRPNVAERFCIFTRQQRYLQEAHQKTVGQQVMDLMSYVEFQKSYTDVLAAHKRALKVEHKFWHLLLRPQVDIRLLTTSFAAIGVQQSKAQERYQRMLQQYSNSPQLVRSYAQFVENSLKDTRTAASLYHQAEEMEVEQSSTVQSHSQGAEVYLQNVDNKRDAMLIVNHVGEITMANENMERLLGYDTGELVGNNINKVVPPPYSIAHQERLLRYIEEYTSDSYNQLQKLRPVLALHKQGHAMAASLGIAPIQGSFDQKDTFMAVMSPIDRAVSGWDGQAQISVSGEVLSACLGVCSILGRKISAVVGQEIWSFAADPIDTHARFLNVMRDVSDNQQSSEFVQSFQNDFGVNIAVNMCITKRVILSEEPFYEVRMNEVEVTQPLIVINTKGLIVYASGALTKELGYTTKELLEVPMTKIMPAALGELHRIVNIPKFIKDEKTIKRPSCMCRTIVKLICRDKSETFGRLTMTSQGQGVGRKWVIEVEMKTPEDYFEQTCSTVVVCPKSLDIMKLNNSVCQKQVGDSFTTSCSLMAAAQNLEQARELLYALLIAERPRPALVAMNDLSQLASSKLERMACVAEKGDGMALMMQRLAPDGTVVAEFWSLRTMRGCLIVDSECKILSACPEATLLLGYGNSAQVVGTSLLNIATIASNTREMDLRGALQVTMQKLRLPYVASNKQRPVDVYGKAGTPLRAVVQTLSGPMRLFMTPVQVPGATALSLRLSADVGVMQQTPLPQGAALVQALAAHLNEEGRAVLRDAGFPEEQREMTAQDMAAFAQSFAPALASMSSLQALDDHPHRVPHVGFDSEIPVKPSETRLYPLAAVNFLTDAQNEDIVIGRSDDEATAAPTNMKSTDDLTSVLSKTGSEGGGVIERNSASVPSNAADNGAQDALDQHRPSTESAKTTMGRSKETKDKADVAEDMRQDDDNKGEPDEETRLLQKTMSDVDSLDDASVAMRSTDGKRRTAITQMLAKTKVRNAVKTLLRGFAAVTCGNLLTLVVSMSIFVSLFKVTKTNIQIARVFDDLSTNREQILADVRLLTWNANRVLREVTEQETERLNSDPATALTGPLTLSQLNHTLLADALINDYQCSQHSLLVEKWALGRIVDAKSLASLATNWGFIRDVSVPSVELLPPTLKAAEAYHIIRPDVLQHLYTWNQKDQQYEALIPTLYSLWEAGNLYTTAALNLARTYATLMLVPNGLQGSWDYLMIIGETGYEIRDGFRKLATSQLKDAFKQASFMYNVTVTLLSVELTCGLLCVICVLYVLYNFSDKRHTLFSVFFLLPTAVIKSMSLEQTHGGENDANLEDGKDDETQGSEDEYQGEIELYHENIDLDKLHASAEAPALDLMDTAPGSLPGNLSGLADASKVLPESVARKEKDTAGVRFDVLSKQSMQGGVALAADPLAASLMTRQLRLDRPPEKEPPPPRAGSKPPRLERAKKLRNSSIMTMQYSSPFIVIMCLSAITYAITLSQFNVISDKLFAMGLVGFLHTQVNMVRTASVVCTYAPSFLRAKDMRSMVLYNIQYLRLSKELLFHGRQALTALPPDLLQLYQQTPALQEQVALFPSGTLGGKMGYSGESLLKARDSGCWRDDQSTCLPTSNPLYSYTILSASDMIDYVWKFSIEMVAQIDDLVQQLAYETPGLPEGDPYDQLGTLSYDAQSALMINITDMINGTLPYQYIYDCVHNDVQVAISWSVHVRYKGLVTTYDLLQMLHSFWLAFVVLIFGLLWWKLLLPLSKQVAAEVNEVSKVLARMPEHANVITLITEVLDARKQPTASSNGDAPRRWGFGRKNRIHPEAGTADGKEDGHGGMGDSRRSFSKPDLKRASWKSSFSVFGGVPPVGKPTGKKMM